ncbi:APC family permease [Bacillus sp. T33-2]|uniref:APC family permease n=1 Tax=Bacillus sp. T33-2 TaxID=2054168 RepID=UPI000C778F9B|nr:APC family permease [Bacillus sp. T33-2]PLR89821.1 APC family permease [Bacillus sp. T33-2]
MAQLKKNQLSYVEAMAISVAIMAPTAAMALNTSLTASIAGVSVPLIFLTAMITIGLVAVTFIQFNRQFSHSGSVYYFTGKSLGPKMGFLSGWALLLTYVMFTIASIAEVGLFAESFFSLVGMEIDWFPVALISTVLIFIFAFADVKIGTRALLILEGISILFILILVFVIFGKADFNSHTFVKPFSPGQNTVPAIALATVFAFLSFAGFEGASSLGEETKNPKRAIPIAIISAVFLTGTFYIIVSFATTIGFGLDAEGNGKFASSSSPLGDLASSYMSSGFAAAIMFGALLSAFSCALASATAGSRMLFSMGRDGFIHNKIGEAHKKYHSPYIALSIIMAFSLVALFPLKGIGLDGGTIFGYLGTIGVLSLLLTYLVTTLGGIRYFVKNRIWKGPILVLPALAVVGLGYSLYSNVYPIPDAPFNYFPYIVIGWIVLGVLITAFSPALVARIAGRLMSDESETETEKEFSA